MEDTSRSEARQFLERLEFVVEPVKEALDQKRADLRVADAEASYLIEVKTRLGSDFEAKLSEHGLAESSVTLAYANPVSSQVKHAVKQLSETSSHPEEFQLLWYQNLDQDECERVVKTLYGIVTVIRSSGESGAESIDCLYLTFSEFSRYPQVVGAVLAHQNGGFLFPNFLSSAYVRFRTSRLFREFHEHDAVQDFLTLERRGDVYIADCEGSRKAENRQEPSLVLAEEVRCPEAHRCGAEACTYRDYGSSEETLMRNRATPNQPAAVGHGPCLRFRLKVNSLGSGPCRP